MKFFGWIAATPEPPALWDLRLQGWELCSGRNGCRAECKHILLCDVATLSTERRQELVMADRPAWRLILLGVEKPLERAGLLSDGCAEALPASTPLRELAARAKRVDDMFHMLPRWREVGPLTLDLFHRDARKGSQWLGLQPREFGLLWRLADVPGERVTRWQLLRDVWRVRHDPQTNSVEVHVSRLRSKLAMAGCADLVETAVEGGYRLASDPAPASPFMLAGQPAEADRLDRYLHALGWQSARTEEKTGQI